MELIFGKDKYRPHPGWAAIRHYCALHKPPVEFHEAFDHFKEMDFDNPTNEMLDDFALLLWCFIDRGCKVDRIDNNLSIDDVLDWIGLNKNISPIVLLLYESYGVEIANVGEPEKSDEVTAENEVKKKE